jgi:gluconolactonase
MPEAPAQQASSAPQILRLDPALDHLIAPNAVPELFVTGFKFTEGPMWRGGRLWFVDEEGDKTHAATPDGSVSTLVDYTNGPYAKPAGTPTGSSNGATTGPNAMVTAQDGTVVAMQQYARDVVHLTEDPSNAAAPVKQTLFFDSYNGKHLNSPNDLVFAPDGSFYFTDPNYGLKQGAKDPAKQLPYQAVFHVKDGKPTPVITDLATPNGIALSPDLKTLYVNNSGPDQRIVAYPLNADGSVGQPHNVLTFTGHEGEGVPDGLKVDSEGNLWSTSPGGIRIITPQGKVLGQIKLPQVAANLAWGGEDGRTLYITARGSVYKLHALIPGNLPLFRR